MAASNGSLSGKTSIVTGGGSGIGRAICQAFAAAGARVVILDKNAAGAEETRSLIGADNDTVSTAICDVSDRAQVAATVPPILAAFGDRIDILCNNAGIMDRMEFLHDVILEEWDEVIATNLTGPFLMARAVLPAMLAAEGGVIVNIASLAGLRGASAGGSYTASKHGVVGLTKNIAWSYAANNIRCNAICPGAVATNVLGEKGLDGLDPAGLERLMPALALMEKVAAPEQLAAVALFLASDAAQFVNGAIISVDGGAAGT